MTRNKSKTSHGDDLSDSELFREATSGARPLKKSNQITPTPNRIKNIRVHRHINQESHSYALSDFSGELNSSTAEEILAYRGNGVQQKLFKKLKNGQIPIESRLDLHGFTVEAARTILSDFIVNSIAQQYRCVIIVHGKGSRGNLPVLKTMLNHWLKQIPDVLAYSSAQPQSGGTGALYALLKRKNDQIKN